VGSEDNGATEKSRGKGKDKESVLSAWGPVADKR